jgi:hypothetical protein
MKSKVLLVVLALSPLTGTAAVRSCIGCGGTQETAKHNAAPRAVVPEPPGLSSWFAVLVSLL